MSRKFIKPQWDYSWMAGAKEVNWIDLSLGTGYVGMR